MASKSMSRRYLANNGIKNKGNTCFFNSSIQALLSLPELVQFLVETSFDPSKQIFCHALQNFIVQYSHSRIVDPSSLIGVLKGKIKLFDGRQQDAHSFLESLISRLSDESETLTPDKTSFLKKILGIHLKDTIRCHKCGFESTVETVSMIHYLFIKKSVQSSLDYFTGHEEMIDQSSPWQCTRCKTKGISSLSHSIMGTSQYLIIYLNRFQNLYSKNDVSIKVDNRIKIEGQVYEVIAIVCHSGTLSGGHYYSYCKRDDEWNEYNDSIVQKSQIPESGGQIYILFYARVN